MIALNGTTETLNVQTVGAGTIHYSVYYADNNTTTFIANSNQGTVATAQTTSILASPASGYSRQVKTFSVVNRATTAQTVIVQKVVGGTVTSLTSNTILGPGQALWYSDDQGFQVRNAQDSALCRPMIVGPVGDTEWGRNYDTSTGFTRIMVNNSSYFVYLGRAPRDGMKTVAIRYRVTAAGVGVTAAEVGIYIGAAMGMPSSTVTSPSMALQCVGYADWSGNYGAIGNYTTTVTLGGSTPIKEGDAVWCAMWSSFATTGATLRVNQSSDLNIGNECVVTAADRQPSLELYYISNVLQVSLTSHLQIGYSFGWN